MQDPKITVNFDLVSHIVKAVAEMDKPKVYSYKDGWDLIILGDTPSCLQVMVTEVDSGVMTIHTIKKPKDPKYQILYLNSTNLMLLIIDEALPDE